MTTTPMTITRTITYVGTEAQLREQMESSLRDGSYDYMTQITVVTTHSDLPGVTGEQADGWFPMTDTICPICGVEQGERLASVARQIRAAESQQELLDIADHIEGVEQHHGMYVCRNCGAATESPCIVQGCSVCGRNLGWERAPAKEVDDD